MLVPSTMARLLAILALAAPGAHATIILIDSTTTLLNGADFLPGTTYYAVFQLTGAGATVNAATIGSFDLGGGSGILRDGGDLLDLPFTLAPDALDPFGIWQPDATLLLEVTPSDAYSLYTQKFISGSSFSFSVVLTSDLSPPWPPDQFAFQP